MKKSYPSSEVAWYDAKTDLLKRVHDYFPKAMASFAFSRALRDYDIEEIEDIIERLLWIEEEYARAREAFEARIKVMKLRNTTGRTPEETETALRIADELEEKWRRSAPWRHREAKPGEEEVVAFVRGSGIR